MSYMGKCPFSVICSVTHNFRTFALFIQLFLAKVLIIDHDFILKWGLAILSYTSLSSIVYLKWKEKAPTWIHYVGVVTFLLLIAILTVTSQTPATDEIAETGHVHEDGTWHAQPHTAGDSRTTYEQLLTEKEQLKSAIERNTEIFKEKREKYQQLLGRYEQLKEQSEIREEVKSEKAEVSEDVPVSPFGFGTYPEVPSDYIASLGLPIWYEHGFDEIPATATHERNIELIDRVLVKLWKDGKDVDRGFYKDGKVYPLYSKSAYVKHYHRIHDNGYTTDLTVIKSSDFDLNLTIERLQNGDIPDDYTILDLDTEGIDPYTFLGL